MRARRPQFLRLFERYGAMPTLWLIAVAVVFSVWLRAAYPPVGIWASHDDLLFVTMADRIAHGEWLGPYDALTLAKGAFFSMFLLVNKASGLPLKISEHVIYLASAFILSVVVSRALRQRWLLAPVFLVLALSPTPWMMEGGARVTREPLYQSLTLAVLAFTIAYFLPESSRKTRLGVALGLLGGCYWLTREEGVWLLPTILLLLVPWLARLLGFLRNGLRRSAMEMASQAFSVLGTFFVVVLLINTINFSVYGVFRNNDLRSGPFPEAYGALARIKQDTWSRYVVFPKDARQRAYAVSPAARELESYFEGVPGKHWAAASHTYPRPWGCSDAPPQSCSTEILSGWFVWALRDAVAVAGYRSAGEADAYYTRLANEINSACQNNLIPCRERRATLSPVWRGHYLRDTLYASATVVTTLIALNHGNVGVPPSPLSVESARVFQLATNSAVSGFENPHPGIGEFGLRLNAVRIKITKVIGAWYANASMPLAVLSLVSYLLLVLTWARVKSAPVSGNSILILTALLGAIMSRVGLLGFLEATSIPSNNMLYLMPVVPLYLLFVVVSIGVGVATFRDYLHRKRVIAT